MCFLENVIQKSVGAYRAVVTHVREHGHVHDRPVTGDGDRQRLP